MKRNPKSRGSQKSLTGRAASNAAVTKPNHCENCPEAQGEMGCGCNGGTMCICIYQTMCEPIARRPGQ